MKRIVLRREQTARGPLISGHNDGSFILTVWDAAL